MNAAILYNEPVAGKPDSEDVLDEVNFVVNALSRLGYRHKLFPVGNTAGPKSSASHRSKKTKLSLNETLFYLISGLKKYKPDIIFNLVEAIQDDPVYEQFFVLLLEHLNYPFTGSRYSAILSTSDKGIAKNIMKDFNVLSPEFNEYRGVSEEITAPPPWIVKPALEDASIGIDESSVFHKKQALKHALPVIYKRHGGQPLIIEQFIRGREFNVSLLETPGGKVEVLPIAEIVFNEWPAEMPMIVGYKAKWDRNSFEYKHTARRFHPPGVKLNELRKTALKCWKIFKLSGYARVDIRMSEDNRVYVLEVNANPCISPDSGFVAALTEAGYTDTDFVKNLIEAGKRHYA